MKLFDFFLAPVDLEDYLFAALPIGSDHMEQQSDRMALALELNQPFWRIAGDIGGHAITINTQLPTERRDDADALLQRLCQLDAGADADAQRIKDLEGQLLAKSQEIAVLQGQHDILRDIVGLRGVAKPAPQPLEPRPAPAPAVIAPTRASRAFARFTTKQHCALQMILSAASNKQIADRMGVTESTAKVYVRSMFGKLGVHNRPEFMVQIKPLFDAWDEAEYFRLAAIPKNWHATWTPADPFKDRYYGPSGRGRRRKS